MADDDREATLSELKASWPQAAFVADDEATRPFINPIFNLSDTEERPSLPLYLKGTKFQIQVWQALLKIPVGTAVSYGSVAQMIGNPKASRAVGSATGNNPIAYLIPCHRVIQQAGKLGQYRWGSSRKKAILGWESAHFSNQ